MTLDHLDRAILAEVEVDGRCSVSRLAAAAKSSHETTRRRLQELVDTGVLFFDVELDNRLLDLAVQNVLWLDVGPRDLHAAGTLLAAQPEVAFAAACTGSAAIVAYVITPNPSALYTYLTTSIAALPGIRSVRSAPVISLLKGPGPLPLR